LAEFWPVRISEHGQIPIEESLLFLPIGGESAKYEGFLLAFAFKDYTFAFIFGLCASTRFRVDEYMRLNYLQSAGTARGLQRCPDFLRFKWRKVYFPLHTVKIISTGTSGRTSSMPSPRGPFTDAVILVPDINVVCDDPIDLTSELSARGFVMVLENPRKT